MFALPRRRLALILAVPFGFLSSWLGLAGESFWRDLGGAAEFFVDVWSASLWADAVFTVGTLVAFALAWRWAHRAHWVAALAGGFLLHWAVYWMSFLSLPDVVGGEDGVVESAAEAITFVLDWGWVGLVFAAVAPVATLWLVRARSATPREDVVVAVEEV